MQTNVNKNKNIHGYIIYMSYVLPLGTTTSAKDMVY